MTLLNAVGFNSMALVICLSVLCVALAAGIGVMIALILKSKKKDRKIMEKDVYDNKNGSLNVESANSEANVERNSLDA